MSDNKKLIFVVDDDNFILQLVSKRLEKEGFDVKSFRYGEECLAHIKDNPDVVILDYVFVKEDEEVMDGMQIFDKIMDIDNDIPVIMLSGQDSGNIVLELARKGVANYVIKDKELVQNLVIAVQEVLDEE